MKKSTARILTTLLGVSFLLNLLFYMGCTTPDQTKPVDKSKLVPPTPPASKAFNASLTLTCTSEIAMPTAQAWIGKVNSTGVRFNNKSIFICADVIHEMEVFPDFNGIWVRRGMDEDSIVHDIAWVSTSTTPATEPTTAYLLEWRMCVCAPCCGTDTSDYRSYY